MTVQSTAYLVIYDRGGIASALVGDDAERLAHEMAKAAQGVVVELPITMDYRDGSGGYAPRRG